MNELLQALRDLPTVERPIRWPDPIDVTDELTAIAVTASPEAARQFVAMVRVVLEHADSLEDVARLRFEAGAYAGGRGAGEVAAMLWDAADAARAGGGAVNQLLDTLQARYNGYFARYDELVNRSQAEGLSDVQETELYDLREQMNPLGERAIQLRDDKERRASTVLSMTGSPMPDGLVRVGHEPELYHPPEATDSPVFFRDLLHAQVDGDPEARSRIDKHTMMMRATGTTTTGGGVVPPTWLFNEFAIIVHGVRPWADTLRKVGIQDANPVNVGVQATPGAAVTAQAAEGNPPNDGSFNANLLTTQPKTYTGKVDVSRQLIDGSNPAIDSLVYADCMGSYHEQIEQAVVAAFEASPGLLRPRRPCLGAENRALVRVSRFTR
jgi:hypothetical protein